MSQKIVFKCKGKDNEKDCGKKIIYTHKADVPIRIDTVELSCGKHTGKYSILVYECKEPGCKEEVVYSPEEIGFEDTVVEVLEEPANHPSPKSTVTVYLSCDAGHCFPYEVEKHADSKPASGKPAGSGYQENTFRKR